MFVKMKMANYNYFCRIDIDEISVYLPEILVNANRKDAFCTNVIMKNGANLLIENTADQIDQLLKDHGTVIE